MVAGSTCSIKKTASRGGGSGAAAASKTPTMFAMPHFPARKRKDWCVLLFSAVSKLLMNLDAWIAMNLHAIFWMIETSRFEAPRPSAKIQAFVSVWELATFHPPIFRTAFVSSSTIQALNDPQRKTTVETWPRKKTRWLMMTPNWRDLGPDAVDPRGDVFLPLGRRRETETVPFSRGKIRGFLRGSLAALLELGCLCAS